MTSCATKVLYKYEDRVYSSSEEALKAQREAGNRDVSQIIATKNPLGGRALLVLPSKTLLREKGVRITGIFRQDRVDHMASSLELSFDIQAESLQRRQIFNEVKIVKSDNPETFTMPGYDFIIYFLIKAPDQAQWFLVFINKEPIPIHADASLPRGVPRVVSWLNNIEKLAKEQRGK